jgi:hypothetical protein
MVSTVASALGGELEEHAASKTIKLSVRMGFSFSRATT